MIRLLSCLALLLLILSTSIHCRRHNDMTADSTLKGVLVLSPSCSHFVVRLLDGNVPDSDVNVYWNDPQSNVAYANVFTVRNWIQFSLANLSVGDTFSFSIVQHVPIMDPYQTCAIWPYSMPPASDNVVNIQYLSGPH